MTKQSPELDYKGAMSLFAPYREISPPANYKNGSVSTAAGKIDTSFSMFGRETPFGDGLQSINSVINGLSGKTALIVFTDGDSNRGSDPVVQAKALYDKYGNNLCIHIVSLADNADGKRVIEEIRKLNGCSVPMDIASLNSDAAMNQYAKDVFYSSHCVMGRPCKGWPFFCVLNRAG